MASPPRDSRRGAEAGSASELLTGFHPVAEALRAGRRRLMRLWLRSDARRPEHQELRRLARERGVELCEVPAEALPRGIDPAARSQGVCLEAGPLPTPELESLLEAPSPRWLVAPDEIQDPQNLGAVARAAEGAGAAGLLLPERRRAPLSPAASRASAGALEHLPVAIVGNLPRELRALKQRGFWVLGTDAEAGIDLFEAPDRLLEGDLVLVLGAEGRGLRPGVRKVVDELLRIPLAGRIDSLNVGAAAAVVLFEWRRRAGVRKRSSGPAGGERRGPP